MEEARVNGYVFCQGLRPFRLHPAQKPRDETKRETRAEQPNPRIDANFEFVFACDFPFWDRKGCS